MENYVQGVSIIKRVYTRKYTPQFGWQTLHRVKYIEVCNKQTSIEQNEINNILSDFPVYLFCL